MLQFSGIIGNSLVYAELQSTHSLQKNTKVMTVSVLTSVSAAGTFIFIFLRNEHANYSVVERWCENQLLSTWSAVSRDNFLFLFPLYYLSGCIPPFWSSSITHTIEACSGFTVDDIFTMEFGIAFFLGEITGGLISLLSPLRYTARGHLPLVLTSLAVLNLGAGLTLLTEAAIVNSSSQNSSSHSNNSSSLSSSWDSEVTGDSAGDTGTGGNLYWVCNSLVFRCLVSSSFLLGLADAIINIQIFCLVLGEETSTESPREGPGISAEANKNSSSPCLPLTITSPGLPITITPANIPPSITTPTFPFTITMPTPPVTPRTEEKDEEHNGDDNEKEDGYDVEKVKKHNIKNEKEDDYDGETEKEVKSEIEKEDVPHSENEKENDHAETQEKEKYVGVEVMMENCKDENEGASTVAAQHHTKHVTHCLPDVTIVDGDQLSLGVGACKGLEGGEEGEEGGGGGGRGGCCLWWMGEPGGGGGGEETDCSSHVVGGETSGSEFQGGHWRGGTVTSGGEHVGRAVTSCALFKSCQSLATCLYFSLFYRTYFEFQTVILLLASTGAIAGFIQWRILHRNT